MKIAVILLFIILFSAIGGMWISATHWYQYIVNVLYTILAVLMAYQVRDLLRD